MGQDVYEFYTSSLFVALICSCSLQFVSQFSQINIWLHNDVQSIGIMDCIDAKCQLSFLAICGNNLRLLCISVVVFNKLEHIMHVQKAWQLIFHLP